MYGDLAAVSGRETTRPDGAALLARATVRAGKELDLSQKTLSRVLGLSEASISRLARGRPLEPSSKEGELALLFLRLFRSLDTLVGGDRQAARAWIHADNHHLGGVPAKLIESVTGLIDVVEYLDAMRGRA